MLAFLLKGLSGFAQGGVENLEHLVGLFVGGAERRGEGDVLPESARDQAALFSTRRERRAGFRLGFAAVPALRSFTASSIRSSANVVSSSGVIIDSSESTLPENLLSAVFRLYSPSGFGAGF